MRHNSSFFGVFKTALYLLQYVKLVDNILERNVVFKTLNEIERCLAESRTDISSQFLQKER